MVLLWVVAWGLQYMNQTCLSGESHGCSMDNVQYGEFRGRVDVLRLFAFCDFCAAGCGALSIPVSVPEFTFFCDLCCIGFYVELDRMGWPLVSAGMGEPWVPVIVLMLWNNNIESRPCSISYSV